MLKSHWIVRGTAGLAGLAAIGSASGHPNTAVNPGEAQRHATPVTVSQPAQAAAPQVKVAVTAFDPDQFDMSAFADVEQGGRR